MRSTFENYLESSIGKQATSKLTWKYATVLQEAEHQAIMGIQAIDMADYGRYLPLQAYRCDQPYDVYT